MAKKTIAPQPGTVLQSKEIPVKASAPGPQRGKQVPRKLAGGRGVDPSMGTATHRRGIQERMGSQLRINVALPGPELPEARATQANGKLVKSYPKQRDNFYGSMADSTSR